MRERGREIGGGGESGEKMNVMCIVTLECDVYRDTRSPIYANLGPNLLVTIKQQHVSQKKNLNLAKR